MNLQSSSTLNVPLKVSRIRSVADPILLELWEIKRQINQQANFDIARLTEQANAFDIHNVMEKLSVARAH